MGTKTVHINLIEDAIIEAFKKTVDDYYNNKIEIEEDFRACLYHHLRPFIDEHDELQMLLSHNIAFETNIIKPDIVIFRKNSYLVAIELKNVNKVVKTDSSIQDYSLDAGLKDIEKIKSWAGKIQRGFFIHIDLTKKKYSYKYEEWKNNYYRELYHLIKSKKNYFYEVKRGEKITTQLEK